jgi:alpha-beta hydrolase superfamily lysophospholipase
LIKPFLKWSIRCALALVIVVATIILVRAFDARKLPELQLWHRTVLEAELTAEDFEELVGLEDYLKREERVFQELDDAVYRKLEPYDRTRFNRYSAGGVVDPDQLPRNWNRSFEFTPEELRGGVLLLHGLTDSPYSMRHLAKIFEARGYYVLGLRMPGHGTIPGSLQMATWRDWMAATRLGARHVRNKVSPDLPFYIAGYSNGGALAVKYTMESLDQGGLPTPDRLFLFSPMIGVSFFARFSDWHKILSWMPYFEKFRWLDIFPEYDPFKYNSFPKAAGEQSFLLTRSIHRQVDQLVRSGRISELPPMLAFQSLVDATVLTSTIVDKLYNKLPSNNSELVLFDVNRLSEVDAFFQDKHDALLRRLTENNGLPYTLTPVTNINSESPMVVARTKPPGGEMSHGQPLGLAWPGGVYSSSHVALPFPMDDVLYGVAGSEAIDKDINIGAFEPRGEKDVLTVPASLLLRLRYNPFFDYMERRILEVLEE